MAHMASQKPLTIASAVEALAGAIHASVEWQRWTDVRQRLETDPQVRRAQERLVELTKSFQQARSQGRGLFGPDLAELNRLHAEIEASPLVRERDEAARELLVLLRETNAQLSAALGIDFAASAAPARSGCCG